MKINHPLQSLEWENFRKETGLKTLRVEEQLLTIHKIPHTPLNIGYIPKGSFPNKKLIGELRSMGKNENCIFVQLEPDIQLIKNLKLRIENLGLVPSAHPLFTRYTFVIDLTKSEQELLENMHSKTRYNIRVAQKHDVKVMEDNSDKAFEEYLKLTEETTQRQGFFAHSESYHRLMWKNLKGKIAHLFIARYKGEVLVAWIVFVYGNTIYYPYGASSSKYREVMASNLMMWEVIRWAKKNGLKRFDMWGALGPNPNEHDPWFGFHRFKQGYGAELTEFVGSYDLVINPLLYQFYKVADKLRWLFLRLI